MKSTDLQILAKKMLSVDPETREETFIALQDEAYDHDDFEEIIVTVVSKMIRCDRKIQLDVLNELPMLLGVAANKVVINFLISPDDEINSLAISLLADNALLEGDIWAVVDLLDHEDPDVRSRAIEVLVADGQEDLVYCQDH